ncbi:MAG: ABC transporter permease [Candidatus Limnocylindrales bacterium]
MTEAKAAQQNRLAEGVKKVATASETGSLVLLIGAIVAFTLLSGTFISVGNISNILAFTPELGMIALAMTLLMTAGEFDLSVGSVFGFTAVIMWTIANETTLGLEVGFVVAMVVGVAIGLVNGFFVTRLRIPSFLVTLGMLLVVRGMALYLTSGFPQRTWNAESPLVDIVVGDVFINTPFGELRIFMSIFWFALFAVVLGYVLMVSRFGNWIQASGGNPAAALARGVRVSRVKVSLFVLTAAMAAYAGITSSIRVSTANPNAGFQYELEVIAMTVIGGTVLTGGKGTIIGTVIGVFLLRVMRNGIVMVGVPGLAYNIFIGAIILGMMALHSYLSQRQRAAI